MAEGISLGLMVGSTPESTSMIKKKAMVYSHGLMVESTMDHGKMASSKVLDSIQIQTVKLEKENSMMAKELTGSEIND
jgi:hypothetical protein